MPPARYRRSREKTGETRAAVLWKRTIRARRDFAKSDEYQDERDGCIFLNVAKDEQGNPAPVPMTRWNVNDGFKSLMGKADLKGLTFDSLRDAAETYGSIGNDDAAVRVLMGHAFNGVVGNYKFRLPEHTADVVATLEKRFFG